MRELLFNAVTFCSFERFIRSGTANRLLEAKEKERAESSKKRNRQYVVVFLTSQTTLNLFTAHRILRPATPIVIAIRTVVRPTLTQVQTLIRIAMLVAPKLTSDEEGAPAEIRTGTENGPHLRIHDDDVYVYSLDYGFGYGNVQEDIIVLSVTWNRA